MKTVLVTTSTFAEADPAPLRFLQRKGFRVVLNPLRRKLSEGEAAELVQRHRPVAILAGVEKLSEKVFAKADGLKAISRCGVGTDSVDLDAAKKRGIQVLATLDAPTESVAELTVALILSGLRQVNRLDAQLKKRRWDRGLGGLLQGRLVGIMGCGRIGTRVAALLAPFGCRILGYDPVKKKDAFPQRISLNRLLQTVDILSVHIPYSRANRHVIGAREIRQMKDGAMIVNASRGGLLDEEALFRALESGKLSWAALDCFEEEPYKGKLGTLPNTTLTPHVGSYTREGRSQMEMEAAQNLVRALGKGGRK